MDTECIILHKRLIKIFNDLCCVLDEGRNAVLVLLDLSPAFDTVDHEILVERLQTRFGCTGKDNFNLTCSFRKRIYQYYWNIEV